MTATSTLTVAPLTLPTARLGPPNPLPPVTGASALDLHAHVAAGDGVDAAMRERMAYGRVTGLAPYLLQDDYGRDRVPFEHPALVLENEVLRATVLPGLGGRLVSLLHRPSGRELLHANPVVQPGNLALRDAWVAGGTEWNLGTTGHSPLTCAPLHAGLVEGPGGEPVLRLWELERLRGLVQQLDLWLPAGSPVLVVAVRVRNPRDVEVPLYWWSNTAVPETDDVRVVAPARAAWHLGEDRVLARVPVPGQGDTTYPARSPRAADWFFDVGDERRPYVAALDAEGRGLVQTSTAPLRGRKLFVWGRGRGGDRWQEWLSPQGGRYLEIQAGVAATQLEHVPLAARSSLAWVETYGLGEVDPAAVHGGWDAARAAVAADVQRLAPDAWLAERAVEADALADRAPQRLLHAGSGWGALEEQRRSAAGRPRLAGAGTPFLGALFPGTVLGPEQDPWTALLASGRLPDHDPSLAPASYVVGPDWAPLLERAVRPAARPGWVAWLHAGVARWEAGDRLGAVTAWHRSLDAADQPWAHRLLAVAHRVAGDVAGALASYDAAERSAPGLRPLVVEHLRLLVAEGAHDPGHDDAVRRLVDALPADVAAHPEVALLDAVAAVRRGDTARARRTLHPGFVWPGLREGVTALGEVWGDLVARELADREGVPVDDDVRRRALAADPVPRELDFRMAADVGAT
ncbi:DUF5107 domain-containing protein [Lapillicoccus jejuensis]|uniref:Uncharacterized protein DUF5107 n=1 Tax=Lapillicoccus jejuensis TaxID=402171 RepID=A0A542E4Q8_9MICO|nr:DUF5107 domain-containing protein [Lapillicoccus jejuensis]TQJ10256.1 uncharacterized protein DUF5107 [Lapillicoccus jejuensis]